MEIKIITPFGHPKRIFNVGDPVTEKDKGMTKELFHSLLYSGMAEPVCDESKKLAKELASKAKADAKARAEAKAKAKKDPKVVVTDVTGLKAQLKTAKGETKKAIDVAEKLKGELNTYKESDKREISELEAKVKSLTVDLAEARSDSAAKVKSLTVDLAEARSDSAAKESEITKLSKKVKTLKEENEALQAMG